MIDSTSPIPKYRQLKEIIKQSIKAGEIKVGDKIPSENELALKYSISRNVVRQAFNELVNEGWLYREQGKGTFCSSIVPENPQQTGIIAVVIECVTKYVYSRIIRGIEDVANNRGYGLLLCNSDHSLEKEGQYLRNLVRKKVDGLIIHITRDGLPYPNIKYFHELRNKGIPFVMVDKYIEELHSDYVKVDDAKGLYTATEYLIKLGHRRIGYVGLDSIRIARDRWKGYRQALKKNGIKYNEDLVKIDNGLFKGADKTTGRIFELINEFLKMGKKMPTAITFFNDLLAIAAIKHITNKGLRVPGDISIVGFDDFKIAKEAHPPLTTVAHPSQEMGKRAAALLFQKIERGMERDENEPRQIVLPAPLVVRGSCQPPHG